MEDDVLAYVNVQIRAFVDKLIERHMAINPTTMY